MLIKYYQDHYDLSKVYKFTITDTSVSLYFPNLFQNGKQEVIHIPSTNSLYKRVVDYLLKDDVVEYKEELAKLFE